MIEIRNLTTIQIDEALVKKIAKVVLEGEKLKKEPELSIAFIGPGRMRKLNKMWRRKNRVTDVLAFVESEIPFEQFKVGKPKETAGLGEVVICLREVKKSAKRLKISFVEELARVVTHGILHLLGYDHESSEDEEKEMREKEEGYLEKLKSQLF